MTDLWLLQANIVKESPPLWPSGSLSNWQIRTAVLPHRQVVRSQSVSDELSILQATGGKSGGNP